jgi:NAD-dependent dihydropyrimidine dehydrogenase PreA subunit
MEASMKSQDAKERTLRRVGVDYRRCHFCGACVAICPPEAMFLWNSALTIRIDICTGCEKCVLVCPVNALAMIPAGSEIAA